MHVTQGIGHVIKTEVAIKHAGKTGRLLWQCTGSLWGSAIFFMLSLVYLITAIN